MTMPGYIGPTDETRRDLANPRTWIGLSPADHVLLSQYMAQLQTQPDEIHTHIPVGMGDTTAPPGYSESMHRCMRALWPRRVDAALRYGADWHMIEAKVHAAHYVLGQILCYAFWWRRDCPEAKLTKLIVVTDHCQDDVPAALAFHNVELIAYS